MEGFSGIAVSHLVFAKPGFYLQELIANTFHAELVSASKWKLNLESEINSD